MSRAMQTEARENLRDVLFQLRIKTDKCKYLITNLIPQLALQSIVVRSHFHIKRSKHFER